MWWRYDIFCLYVLWILYFCIMTIKSICLSIYENTQADLLRRYHLNCATETNGKHLEPHQNTIIVPRHAECPVSV